eukprot:1224883-Alexandrium_andersonii.AAC.1
MSGHLGLSSVHCAPHPHRLWHRSLVHIELLWSLHFRRRPSLQVWLKKSGSCSLFSFCTRAPKSSPGDRGPSSPDRPSPRLGISRNSAPEAPSKRGGTERHREARRRTAMPTRPESARDGGHQAAAGAEEAGARAGAGGGCAPRWR